MFDNTLIWAVIVTVLAVVVVRKSVIIVRQGFEYTIERFGRYSSTFSPGFHIMIPFVNRVGQRVNMMEQVLDVPSQEVISKDNAVLTVDGVVFFQVLDENFMELQRERTFVNYLAGETRTCVGCHETPEDISPPRQATAIALRRRSDVADCLRPVQAEESGHLARQGAERAE